MLKFTHIFLSFCAAVLLVACSKSDEPTSGRQHKQFKRTILVYAVASNNLYGSAIDDMNEMLLGAQSVDLNEYSLMLYMVKPQSRASDSSDEDGSGADYATLSELVRGRDGAPEFVEVKKYSRDVFSTDPRRLSEVISDVKTLRKADGYGLILWSHGTGWEYEEVKHPTVGSEKSSEVAGYPSPDNPQAKRSFGMDKYDGMADYMNIDELAAAIPSGLFDFIWFDACYMSGIETIYQLRNKCDYFVGYPTEVWSPGMPYDQTLPLLLKETPNLVGAADLFADYYSSRNDSYTIAVLRTDNLEKIAQTARVIYSNDDMAPAASALLKYSRTPCGPFYDFRQFTLGFEPTQESSVSEDAPLNSDGTLILNYKTNDALTVAKNELSSLLASATLYKSASPYNFMYPGYGVLRDEYLIPEANFSGINCHYFPQADSSTAFSDYYRSLDWYRDAIQQ